MIKGFFKRFVKFLAVICIVGFLLVFLVHCKPDQTFPNEGIWYCEDLQIQICFDRNQAKYETHIIKDDEKINCGILTDYGNRFFSIVYQDTICAEYNYDTCFYAGEFISFDDDTLITRDTNTQKVYVFTRIDAP